MHPRFKHWLFDKESSSLRDFFDHLKNGLVVAVVCLSLQHIPSTMFMAPVILYLSAIGAGILCILWMWQFMALIDKAPLPILTGQRALNHLVIVLFAVFYLVIFFAISSSFLVALNGYRSPPPPATTPCPPPAGAPLASDQTAR